MTRQMMQCNALTEVKGLIIKGLPVEAQFQIMFEIHPLIRTRSHRPKRTLQLPIMHPDLHIRPIQKFIQPTRMIEMQMPDDDLLDILHLVPRRLHLRTQLMARFIPHPRKDIGEGGTPDFRVVFAAAGFPEDEPFVGVFDEDAVAREFAAFVDKGFGLGGFGGGVAAAHDEGFVAFEPADFEDVEFGSLGADVGDVVGHGAAVELGLDACHGGGGGEEGCFVAVREV